MNHDRLPTEVEKGKGKKKTSEDNNVHLLDFMFFFVLLSYSSTGEEKF